MQKLIPLQLSLMIIMSHYALAMPPSKPTIESTLEVLQGANLGPSNNMLCGPACLYIGVRSMGVEEYTIDEIAMLANWDYMEGTSLLGLQNACQKMQLHAEAFAVNIAQLENMMERNNAVAIIENQGHFYLFLKLKDGKFLVVTTPVAPEWVEKKKVQDLWDGKALLFSTQPLMTDNDQWPLVLLAVLAGAIVLTIGVVHSFKKSHHTV